MTEDLNVLIKQKKCDKSYNWNFIKKDIDPEKYKIPSQIKKLNAMLRRKNNDVKIKNIIE